MHSEFSQVTFCKVQFSSEQMLKWILDEKMASNSDNDEGHSFEQPLERQQQKMEARKRLQQKRWTEERVIILLLLLLPPLPLLLPWWQMHSFSWKLHGDLFGHQHPSWPQFKGHSVTINQIRPNKPGTECCQSDDKRRKAPQVIVVSPDGDFSSENVVCVDDTDELNKALKKDNDEEEDDNED